LQLFVLKKTGDGSKRKKLVPPKKLRFAKKKNASRPNVGYEQRNVHKPQRPRAYSNSAKRQPFVVPRRGVRQPRLPRTRPGAARRSVEAWTTDDPTRALALRN